MPVGAPDAARLPEGEKIELGLVQLKHQHRHRRADPRLQRNTGDNQAEGADALTVFVGQHIDQSRRRAPSGKRQKRKREDGQQGGCSAKHQIQ
ncbi:hypothetical protein D3C87_1816020 [compost metagenome]